MTMNPRRTVVGVFDEPAMASRTVELLQGAGFSSGQISYMDPSQNNTGGGFLAGLKRLFTGSDADSGDVTNDLTDMGLTQDEARYYSDQYGGGHAIVAVMPDSREQEQAAMELLRSNGAHSYTTASSAAQMGTTTQSTDYTQADTYAQPTDSGQRDMGTQRTDYGQTDTYAQPAGYDQTNMSTQRTDYGQTDTYAQPAGYDQTDMGTQRTDSGQTDTYAQPTDFGQRDMGTQRTDYSQTGDYADTNEQRSLKLREEQLRAEKERVQTGEVQLHKDVVTEQKTINVPVTHEEVVIERHAVTGDQVDDAAPIGEGETIRVPVSEEQVNVTKTPMVTGEVTVGKRAVQENQQVTDTVKREEARLDRSGDVPIEGTNASVLGPDSETM
jgi:uncharacterized protein (TIGR02271 family)